MSTNLEKVVKLYRSLCKIATLIGARLSIDNNVVLSYWTQKNLEYGRTVKFVKSYAIAPDFKLISTTIPADTTFEILTAISPSEQYKAIIREISEKQYLEIWKNHTLSHIVDLRTLDIHGQVYTDYEFGTLQWSSDETRVLYIAELKLPKSEPFYKPKPNVESKPKENADIPLKGEEYVFRQDWGESLNGKKHSVIVEYNLKTDTLNILTGIPENICPGQVIYAPDDSYVVGVAYETEPRKMGLVSCTNRRSTIFTLDFDGNYSTLPLKDQSVRNPIFTLDKKYLVWFQRSIWGPHTGCLKVVKAPVPLNSQTIPEVVVGIVHDYIETDNGRRFYGFYNPMFPKRCFATRNRLVLSTNQKNTINSYVVDLDNGRISEIINEDGSLAVLDVFDDIILAARRNYFKQDSLLIGTLPSKNEALVIKWTELSKPQSISGLENSMYEYLELTQNTTDTIKNFTAIYIGPKTAKPKTVKLIIKPHGGPHGSFSNTFSLEIALLVKLGYAILAVNFRGSGGAGQDTVEFLLGRIGTADVADCYLATDEALKKYPWLNPDCVGLSGSSHGGFLVTHLSGQFPDKYKAVVARNPVIDVTSMMSISDIPDWAYHETGYQFTQCGPPNLEAYCAMRKASPLEYAHEVKAPTLLQVGSKDLRVPPCNSIEYYTRLKANCVKVKMYLYEDGHLLNGVTNELDHIINSWLWFEEHLN